MQLCKPETQSRVCITVEDSPNYLSCIDEAMETRKKRPPLLLKSSGPFDTLYLS